MELSAPSRYATDLSPEEYTRRTRAREITAIRKKAARLGLTVVEGQA
jgi:hypothetical protein